MPVAAYLLMALEAARQLLENQDCDANSLRLSNFMFEQPLPLSVFPDPDTAIETQLIARQMDGTNMFEFEIFTQRIADGASWTRHCFVNFEAQSIAASSTLNSHDHAHDRTLMDQAKGLNPGVGKGLYNLKLSPEGSSGKFKCTLEDAETYALDPTILNSILRLPPLSLSGQNVPAEYHISSLASITVPISPPRSQCGHFTSLFKPFEFYSIESDIEIRQSANIVSLRGVQYRTAKVAHQKPASNSLFFKPVLFPDITRLSAAPPMNISRCAELLTHKWPMCDIKIDDVSERCTKSVLQVFSDASGEARFSFRSITCTSLSSDLVSDRIQLSDSSDVTSKYHMVVVGDVPHAAQLSDQLHPGGVLCVPKAQVQDLQLSQNWCLEAVCDVVALDLDPWVLLRKATDLDCACANRRAILFTNQDNITSLNALEKMESVPLEPAAVALFCEHNSLARFDAVILDCAEKSIITTWTGSQLMPWVQMLLKFADSILWVTSSRYQTPFANVAGSLLRSLQSEQPSLRTSWLVNNEMANEAQATFASQVEQAYMRMIDGENEHVTRSGDLGVEILRYLPDDDLSADTGLSLPRKVRSPIADLDYSLGFAAPREPVILSYKNSLTPSMAGEFMEVLTEASVIDLEGLHMFNGTSNLDTPQTHSGFFFAGRVLYSQNPDFPPESRVVGWHPNRTHCKKVRVRSSNVSRLPRSMQPSQAAARYAAIALASCIIDGTARARQSETFRVEVEGPLLEAVEQFCKQLGASVLNSSSQSKADFVVTLHSLKGLHVNGRSIDCASYLQSDHGRELTQRVFQDQAGPPFQIDEYEIGDYKEALNNTKRPCSTVLLHRDAVKCIDHVPIYKKSTHMFADDADYVVIGGLGGLGRFICSWMIENGAKHITAISRSGTGTPEARDTISAMETSGASIQCIKADACDRGAISEILSKLRDERPIKGIINLAMVLGDAPMADMTAEEWDRGLRVKIDSSWILHEETMRDHLDFFILFSSVASVLGNRSQGNYNVANTFLNALAEYRQSLDLPGISVALGAMSKFSSSFLTQVHQDLAAWKVKGYI